MGGGSRRLRESKLRTRKDESGINPMDGLANLADVMLVLACGLMLSLIVHWNVDVGRTEKLVGLNDNTKLTEVKDAEQKKIADFRNGQGFEEMGTVFRDSATGKLYVVTDQESTEGVEK
jgi:Uncharacterized conserved protein